MQEQKAFWLRKLAGPLPEPDLSFLPVRRLAGAVPPARYVLRVSGAPYQRLKQFTAAANVSDFMFLLSVQYLLLAKMSGSTDIIIGTDVVGRTQPGMEGIVGTFINVLPLRMEIAPGGTYAQLLAGVKECVLEAFENQDFGLDQIVAELNAGNNRPRNLFDVHFSYANYLSSAGEWDALQIASVAVDVRETTPHKLIVEAREGADGLEVHFVFGQALQHQDMAALLVQYYYHLLNTVTTTAAIPLEEIELEGFPDEELPEPAGGTPEAGVQLVRG
jgi:non-ribosomal peptide synthetase component F